MLLLSPGENTQLPRLSEKPPTTEKGKFNEDQYAKIEQMNLAVLTWHHHNHL